MWIQGAGSISEVLRDGSRAFRRHAFAEFDLVRESLTPVQVAVLCQIVRDGSGYAPYGASTMDAYAARMGVPSVTKSEVQGAIAALREKGLVWKSERGEYALEDAAVGRWMADEAGYGTEP